MKPILLLTVFSLFFLTGFAGDQIIDDLKLNLNVNCDSTNDSKGKLGGQTLSLELLVLSGELFKSIHQRCQDGYYFSASGNKVYRSKIHNCFSNTLTNLADTYDLYCLKEYADEFRLVIKDCSEIEQTERMTCYKKHLENLKLKSRE